MTLRLLVVDDEPNQRQMLAEYLTKSGYAVLQAQAAEEALEVLKREEPDIVLTDLRLPGADGVELIRRARSSGLQAEFVVLTAFGSISNAVDAMRAGARDYLTKPVRLDDLDASLSRLRAGARVAHVPAESDAGPFDGLGSAMREVKDLIDRVAVSDATVLVTGESGTGKELAADRLHRMSKRAKGPFVKINCTSLPESLLESELFGFEKGSFTGAAERRPGLFEAAHGGTILLDEIGDIGAGLQVRLLRVLQEREVMRVGSRKPIPVDFRLVAATHRNLEEREDAGLFRRDLLYRLKVVEIRIPPLRDRPGDIPVLADRLIRRLARRNGVPYRPLGVDACAALVRHPFPGNVRQLEHMLERALVLAQGEELAACDFDQSEIVETSPAAPTTLREAVEELERAWIRDALERCGGVRARAARLLGLPDRVLRYKLRKYGMDRRGKK